MKENQYTEFKESWHDEYVFVCKDGVDMGKCS